MKTTYLKLTIAATILLGIYSCKKREIAESDFQAVEYKKNSSSDSISSVATTSVKDKKFIKIADVNMEVRDVYDATISIEKSAQELGGFVTHSYLKSLVVSEDIYNISDEDAMLIKKYQTENSMQVRVPNAKLGELLTLINDKKLFLNSRIIKAEDVTAGIKYAELEEKRNKETSKNISKLTTTKDKVKMSDENRSENNHQQLDHMNIADHIQYSTVDIYIKEPKLRIAEITIPNSNNIDNKYKLGFLYSVKNAFVEGYYLILKIALGLIVIWPIILIAAVIFYFYRKNKSSQNFQHPS